MRLAQRRRADARSPNATLDSADRRRSGPSEQRLLAELNLTSMIEASRFPRRKREPHDFALRIPERTVVVRGYGLLSASGQTRVPRTQCCTRRTAAALDRQSNGC